MSDEKNQQVEGKLADEELGSVAGGWGSNWGQAEEDKLPSDYRAANPDHPNPTDSELDMFLEAVGLRDGIDDSLVYSTLMARIRFMTVRSGT